MAYIKNMKYNSRRITLTTDIVSPSFQLKGIDTKKTEIKAKALAILLGEYNKYGRSIDLDVYQKAQDKFDEAVDIIKCELDN